MKMKSNLKNFLFAFCMALIIGVNAQDLERVEPPFWWSGMQNDKLQLLVKSDQIGGVTEVLIKENDGPKVVKLHPAENTDYLFVDLDLAGAKTGTYTLEFKKGKKSIARKTYELRERSGERDVIGNEDVIYLITPDRFANGNTENDSVEELEDKFNREHFNGRHGGDLGGILSKLDYMEDLGVTTLWLNPVLENAMPRVTYHGYAITDYYNVDKRYGDNEMYRQLSEELSKRGMKLIMDMVFNHSGSEHWWIKEPPFSDWVHFQGNYTNTNHAMTSIPDPYSSEADERLMEQGWFVSVMPDLNHDNPFMEEYLIQNSIWWIEYAGLEGIRMDTYPYNKIETMQRWAKRVLAEYPEFYLVGESWIHSEVQEAYWAPQGSGAAYNSGLTSITDFPLCNAIHAAFGEKGDLRSLYDVLSKDFAYHQPFANKIFADNHDMDRFYHTIGEDLGRFKNAMTFLLTTRGIPQLYYGTEILMRKHGEHGVLREDFPGGWAGDDRNAFTTEGRTAEENEAFNHLRTLLNWRKGSKAAQTGDLKHFVPYDNIYVYSRSAGNEKVVVFMNNNEEDKELKLDRFAEILEGYDKGTDVLTNKNVSLGDQLSIPGNSSFILTLEKEEAN